jgi:hypothetical protein
MTVQENVAPAGAGSAWGRIGRADEQRPQCPGAFTERVPLVRYREAAVRCRLDAHVGQDGIEGRRELASPVANEKLNSSAGTGMIRCQCC